MRMRLAIGLSCFLTLPAGVGAQMPSTDTRRWEIEIYGGVSLPNSPSDGITALPAAGAPLTTSSPLFPSREVSSWFFGSGAELLNDVNAAFGVVAQILALDAGFREPRFDSGGAGAVGVRVRRALRPRVWLEIGIDTSAAPQSTPEGLAATAEASRQTFESAFRGLLATGPFSNVAVAATRETADGSSRGLAATAALNVHFAPRASFEPYITAGGGVSTAIGDAPSMMLEGRYRFGILGAIAIDETDRVTVRVERKLTPLAVVGGGVRRQLSQRWGLRIDGRVFIGPGGQRITLDAAPSSVAGAPGAFIESFTHPSVQFSNDPSTGRRSTLSGPRIQDFEVFSSDGLGTRFLVTAGLAARF